MSVDDLMDALFGDEDEEELDLDLDLDEDSEDDEEEIEEVDLDGDVGDLEKLLAQLGGGDEDVVVGFGDDEDDEDDEDEVVFVEDDDDEEDVGEEIDFDEDDFEDYEIGGGVEASCPHCGEAMEIFVDPSAGAVQDYVEDCSVCCRPSTVRVTVDKDGVSTVDLDPLD